MTYQSFFIDANVRAHRFLYSDDRWKLLLKRENVIKIDEKCDFDGVFELQWSIKNFPWVQSSYNKYIKCSPRSGEYSALKIASIRHHKHFLLTKVCTPPHTPTVWTPPLYLITLRINYENIWTHIGVPRWQNVKFSCLVGHGFANLPIFSTFWSGFNAIPPYVV